MTEQQQTETLHLNPQTTLDRVMTWECRLANSSTALSFAITHPGVSALAGPPATSTDPRAGEYIAQRLNRAAFLEAALLDMIQGVHQILQNHPAIASESVLRNLARVWNGPETPPAGAVVN